MKSLPEQHRARLLHRALMWLTLLRWFAGIAILVAGLLDSAWLHWFDRGAPAVVLGAAILAFNTLVLRSIRWALAGTDRDARLISLASIEICFDLVCLSLIAAWTDGIYSPAMALFYLHMIFASLLQPRKRALASAMFAIVAVATVFSLCDKVPSSRQEWLLAASWCFTLIALVVLSEGITRALYRREHARVAQLVRLKAMSRRLHDQQRALIQSEKMVAVGQLAAGIAHEINNPLSNMDSVLQLIQRKPDVPKPEVIAALREQIRRIHRIIRQLTAFAHPGDGAFEVLSVNDVVQSSAQIVALDKRLKGDALECFFAPDAGRARLNPHAMEQVIANLVVNAIDATADVAAPRITVRTRKGENCCYIEIADNGAGIAPEHLTRIFEPFFTTKPIGRGTGLGLWISARLVRDHDGTIEVTSTPGAGTTFVIRIPAGAEESGHTGDVHTPPAKAE